MRQVFLHPQIILTMQLLAQTAVSRCSTTTIHTASVHPQICAKLHRFLAAQFPEEYAARRAEAEGEAHPAYF